MGLEKRASSTKNNNHKASFLTRDPAEERDYMLDDYYGREYANALCGVVINDSFKTDKDATDKRRSCID